MTRSIKARVMLSRVKQPDNWFGLSYSMNLYRGCQHQCIYCDSRSECYGIEDFAEVLVKSNAVELLRNELSRKRNKGTIGTGSMHDPYMPIEKQTRLTRQALEVIAEHRFPVHIATKSDLVLRDTDTIKRISPVYAAVSFTITTADDRLGRKLEPAAPLPSARFQAMKELSGEGILTGVLMMPVLPFIEDTEENVTAIVTRTAQSGGSYIVPWFGMSLRDRQREYYYDKLDALFPGLRKRYEERYADRYSCPVPNARKLESLFNRLCTRHNVSVRIPAYQPAPVQPSLF